MLLILIFIFSLKSVTAQNYLSSKIPEFYFNQGITLYQSGDYRAAKHMMDEFIELEETPEALYYRAVSAIKSEQKSGENYVNSFVRDYPLHPLAHKARFELGHHYFSKNIYLKAVSAFNSLDMNSLGIKEKEKFYFENGYAMLQLKMLTNGVEMLKKANEIDGDFKYSSAYYLGVMTDGAESETWFHQAAQSPVWAIKSGLYLSQIYLKSGEYEKLQVFNEPYLDGSNTQENLDLHLYTAESYYQQSNYREAMRVYEKALELNIKISDSEILFKMGHTFYETGKIQHAIDQLKRSGLNETPTGQASAFQLARIYTEQGKFTSALHAYEIAGASDHDLAIKEQAQFLAGKVSVQIGQFDQAIVQLEDFLSKFPSSKKNHEANDLLSTAYLNSSNYDLVIQHFESQTLTSRLQQQNYQQVCLIKGTQAFSDRKIEDAVIYLKKSLKTPVNSERKQAAYYWLGECYSQLNDSDNARRLYNLASSRFPKAYYGLGYLAFNDQNYAEAKSQFQTYITKSSVGTFHWDARLRVSDCDYALKNYDQALVGYETLEEKPVAHDYRNYQIGLIHQLNGRVDKAVEAYMKVTEILGSTYRDNALFQIAQTYLEDASFEQAIEMFDEYIRQFPKETSTPYARLKRAQSKYNLSNMKEAKKDYVYILNNHISHPAAQHAIIGIQELQKSGISIDFDRYLADYSAAHPDDSNIVTIEFEQAKNFHFNGDYSRAISQLNALLRNNQNSPFEEEIIYYLADSHDKKGELNQAYVYYEKIIEKTPSKYLNRTLDKRGKILLELDKGKLAFDNYLLLQTNSKNRKENYLAMEGLMKASFMIEDYNKCIEYGREIEIAEWKPSNAENEALLFIGKSFTKLGNNTSAMNEFVKVLNRSPDELGAEANYRIAEIHYKKDNYHDSLESLFELNSKYGAYQNWIGESFLLIADNYIALEEFLQAKATLNSLIDKFPDLIIKDRATTKMMQIDKLNKTETEQE